MLADSARVLAGQTLIAGFPAGELPAVLRKAAQAGELGGFILFRRNLGDPEAVAEQNAELCAICKPELPPLIAVDQEGGRVARLGPPVAALPPMRRLGARDDPALTEDCAYMLGQQLALLGFSLDFAPVLDVDSNPQNPVIGDRSFGADPERVIRHGGAFARGLARAGIASCGKHFPGHGDTELDSHLALPRVSHARERLDRIELAPFTALARRLPSIMTAHVVFDALDTERPATLSRRVLHELLRTQLGFSGVIVSDDLEMAAITDHYGTGEAACAAIDAGCDALLVCSDPDRFEAALEALVARARADAGFERKLHDAATRCLALRRAHAPKPTRAGLVTALQRLHDQAHERLHHGLDQQA